MKQVRGAVLLLVQGAALAACTGENRATAPSDAAAPAAMASAAPKPASAVEAKTHLAAEVGRSLFFDKTLSASGTMSCATCHDPDHAYGPPNDLAVQLGGPKGDQPGIRAVPSLRYKEYTPPYADLLDNPDGFSAPGPGGGFAWDGRADTLAEQAAAPLLSPFEMANASAADVVAKVRATPYAATFARAFGGDGIWKSDDAAFKGVLAALQAFQLEDTSFHPYTSKFDLHAGNKIGGTYTPAEMRGVKVFVDPKTGNCSSCHYPGAGIHGSSGLFTDFSYEAIGVPRNPAIPANADPLHFDLGICGPLRIDHAAPGGAPSKYCGMFKTPTLRNVATRSVFFHNGVIHSLEDAVRFYNTRDTAPQRWYPTARGAVHKFDDIPKAYRSNLDPQMPLDGRAPGSKPPMTEQNIADLLCFLKILNDGYTPPASPPPSGAPCVD
jgi:cytochrome c peroxidase